MGLVFSFFVGLCLGSFANVLICRLPKEESYIAPSSYCPNCRTKIRAVDLIPIFSYIFLRGKCRTCGVKISLQYPFTELVFGVLALWLYSRYGFSMQLVIEGLFLFCLYAIFFIDLRHFIIPNTITFFMMLLGLSLAFFNPFFPYEGFLNIVYSFAGLLVGGGLLWLLAVIGEKIFKQEAMGGGDIKLFAGIGSMFGPMAAVTILFYSSIVGGLVSGFLMLFKIKKRRDVVPFGPFICLGCLVWLYAGKYLAFLWEM